MASVEFADDRPTLEVANRGLLTVGVLLAMIVYMLDATIANVALPHMQASLGATFDTITWVLTSYIIALAVATPITGWLSDCIGSRNLFLIAVAGLNYITVNGQRYGHDPPWRSTVPLFIRFEVFRI